MTGERPSQRDLRIDLVRGVALLLIFSSHIRGNVIADYLPRALGLADNADAFIFLSGYSCGLAYGRRFAKTGFLGCLGRALKRAGQVYAVKIAVTMAALGIIVCGEQWDTPFFFGTPWSLQLVKTYPFETLLQVQLFRLELLQFFILALYIPFLLFLPFVLVGLVQHPWVTIFISTATYSTVQFFPRSVALPEPWRGALCFNPFAWQFLFFSACALALMKPEKRARLRPNKTVTMLALIVFVTAISIHLRIDELRPYLSDKRNLGFLRVIHFAATLFVGWSVIPSSQQLSNVQVLSPILTLGKYPLVGYCIGGVLAILGEIVLNAWNLHWIAQLTVNLVGWTVCLAAVACWGCFGRLNQVSGDSPEQ